MPTDKRPLELDDICKTPVDEAAKISGFETPKTYSFDPSLFSGYSHTNTNDDDSALDSHRCFATWVFRLKK